MVVSKHSKAREGEREGEAMEKKLGIYCRVSTPEQKKNETIEQQVKLGKEWAKQNGIKDYKLYKDDGVSGAKSNRKGFNELIEDIENEEIGIVWFYDTKRLAREASIALSMFASLKENNVKLFIENAWIDFENPEHKLMFGIKAVFGEYDRTEITKTMGRGFLAKKDNGEMPVRLYGWKKKEPNRKGLLAMGAR